MNLRYVGKHIIRGGFMMNDLLKKGFLLGLGVAITSKEKVENYVDELVNKGQIAPGEAKQMIQELIEKGEQTESELDDDVRQKIKLFLHSNGFVTLEEHQDLEKRVQLLEKEQRNSN